MTDVGGQRSERRKWLHLFHGVDVVVYVADISSYDVVDEEYQSNAFMASLSVFTSLSKREWLKETRFILVLNKIDLFKEKLQRFHSVSVFHITQGVTIRRMQRVLLKVNSLKLQ